MAAIGADRRSRGWTALSIVLAANRHFFEPIVQKDVICAAIGQREDEAVEDAPCVKVQRKM